MVSLYYDDFFLASKHFQFETQKGGNMTSLSALNSIIPFICRGCTPHQDFQVQ
jgi:hypothetical protein